MNNDLMELPILKVQTGLDSFKDNRRKSRRVMVGDVPVGGGAPISVQSMTKTKTGDVKATLEQIRRVQEEGCDIIRVTVNDEAGKPKIIMRKVSNQTTISKE